MSFKETMSSVVRQKQQALQAQNQANFDAMQRYPYALHKTADEVIGFWRNSLSQPTQEVDLLIKEVERLRALLRAPDQPFHWLGADADAASCDELANAR